MSVSDLARHSTRPGRDRDLSRARLQLPHDRHAGARSACASSRCSTRSSSAAALLAERYNEALARIPHLEAPYDPPYAQPHLAVLLRAGRPGSPVGRTELMQRLLEDGIATRRGVMAIHEEQAYASRRAGPAAHRGGGAGRPDAAAVRRPHVRAAGLRDRAARRAHGGARRVAASKFSLKEPSGQRDHAAAARIACSIRSSKRLMNRIRRYHVCRRYHVSSREWSRVANMQNAR